MPVTPDDFRRIALSLPETSESAHMDHPDFRVRGKIFATMFYPDKDWAMVKLSPEHQHEFSHNESEVFVPVKGTWGRRGATSVWLKKAKKSTLRKALTAAWLNTAPKRLAQQFKADAP
jgi:hypothetical protein